MRYKVIIPGENHIRKFSFIKRIKTNTFSTNTSYIGMQAELITITFNEHTIPLSLRNIKGDEAFDYMGHNYVTKNLKGIILLYDITNKSSFHQMKSHFNLIKGKLGETKMKKVVLYVVGNKIELEMQRKVDRKEVIDFCMLNKIKHFECSVKTGENVSEIIYLLSQELILVNLNENKQSLIPHNNCLLY